MAASAAGQRVIEWPITFVKDTRWPEYNGTPLERFSIETAFSTDFAKKIYKIIQEPEPLYSSRNGITKDIGMFNAYLEILGMHSASSVAINQSDEAKKAAVEFMLNFQANYPDIYDELRKDYQRVISKYSTGINNTVYDYNTFSRNLAYYFMALHGFFRDYYEDTRFINERNEYEKVQFDKFANYPQLTSPQSKAALADKIKEWFPIDPRIPQLETYRQDRVDAIGVLAHIEQLEGLYSKQRTDATNILKYLTKKKRELISKGPFGDELRQSVLAKMPPPPVAEPTPAPSLLGRAMGAVSSAASTTRNAARSAISACTLGRCGRPAAVTQRAPRVFNGPSNANLEGEFSELRAITAGVSAATGAAAAPSFPVIRRSNEGLGAGAGTGASAVRPRGRAAATTAATTAAATTAPTAAASGRRKGSRPPPKKAGGYRKTQRRHRRRRN